MANPRKVLDFLFVSKVRIKALRYFFLHKDVPIHLRGAARQLNEEINAVRRELMRLHEIKLLKATTRGNRKYFSLNTEFPFYDEINSMVMKTFGLGGQMLKNQKDLGNIYFAALTTAYTKGVREDEKDIDLMVVGDANLEKLSDLVKQEEQRINREINYTVLRLSDFDVRKRRNDPFIMKVVLESNVLVIGNRDDYVSS